MIAAGKLNQVITFYGRTDQKENDYGSMDETYAEGITCRAQVKFISGSEVIRSETLANTQAVQFIIRYRSGINEKMRILYDGSYYAVRVIEHDEKKTMQTITTAKIVT